MLRLIYYFVILLNGADGTLLSCCGCPPPFQAPCQSQFQRTYVNYPVQQQQLPKLTYVQALKESKIYAKSLPYDSYEPHYVRPQPVKAVYVRSPSKTVKKDPCYMNASGFKCCNSDLENSMHGAYSDLKKSSDFNDCNIGLIAKVVQKAAQKRFQLSFETVVGLKMFGSNSAYEGNYTCRFERDGKHFMTYASPIQYNITNVKSENALAIADITHDDKNDNSTGEVISDEQKKAKIEKINKELVNVEPTGKELHERRQRAIRNSYDAVFIEENEFIAFSRMNTTAKSSFVTHDLTMGSFNPSLTRMKLKNDRSCT